MDRQCSSCGGFCKQSGCERENVATNDTSQERVDETEKDQHEPVQTTPNFAQLKQILDNLDRCHHRDSKQEFLRTWIRDWTEHKLTKHTTPPRRTWVGLTDEDVEEVERWVEFKEEGSGRIPTAKLVRYIETKLKEKTRTWVGLSTDEFKFIASKYLLSREAGLEYFQEEIEAKLKENNT